eukprot:TRINITY_DN4757_c0_g2_i3.p2 TRINITY_DN4757_c0_g2~~TRINITY_DN4757_c0_g2_i3.p2  ORF type:complete len:361 (-),score=99.04 TRINITY_DN4757_c0_g2_i3:1626-2708(-)
MCYCCCCCVVVVVVSECSIKLLCIIIIIFFDNFYPPHSSLSSFLHVFNAIKRNPPPTLQFPQNFSNTINEWLSLCLVKDPGLRPTCDDLYKHHFIQQSPNQSSFLPIVEEVKKSKLKKKIEKENHIIQQLQNKHNSPTKASSSSSSSRSDTVTESVSSSVVIHDDSSSSTMVVHGDDENSSSSTMIFHGDDESSSNSTMIFHGDDENSSTSTMIYHDIDNDTSSTMIIHDTDSIAPLPTVGVHQQSNEINTLSSHKVKTHIRMNDDFENINNNNNTLKQDVGVMKKSANGLSVWQTKLIPKESTNADSKVKLSSTSTRQQSPTTSSTTNREFSPFHMLKIAFFVCLFIIVFGLANILLFR